PDNAWHSQQGSVAHLPDHFTLGNGAYQFDSTLKTQTLDLRLQDRPQNAGADDPATEKAAALDQHRTGIDQIIEALLLNEPAHRQNHRRAVIWRAIRILLEIQSVVDALHIRRQGSVGGTEVVEMVIADGNDSGRVGELAAKVVVAHALVEDVLGARGKAVRHSSQATGQAGYRRRLAGKRRVHVMEVFAAYLTGELHRLVDVARFFTAQPGTTCPDVRQNLPHLVQSLPEVSGGERRAGQRLRHQSLGGHVKVIDSSPDSGDQ